MASFIHRFERPTTIIVEGMDNTGKTQLCDALSRAFDLPVIHSIGGPEVNAQTMSDWLRLWLHRSGQTGGLILDRVSIISEEIYGPVLRDHSNLHPDTVKQLWQIVDAEAPVIIYCRPPMTQIMDTILEREQMDGVAAQTHDLVRAYDRFFSNLDNTRGFMTYSWVQDPKAEKIIDQLIAQRKD